MGHDGIWVTHSEHRLELRQSRYAVSPKPCSYFPTTSSLFGLRAGRGLSFSLTILPRPPPQTQQSNKSEEVCMHTGQWFLFRFTFSFIRFFCFFTSHTFFSFPPPTAHPSLSLLPTSFPFPIACSLSRTVFPRNSSGLFSIQVLFLSIYYYLSSLPSSLFGKFFKEATWKIIYLAFLESAIATHFGPDLFLI
ncbi:hypothetical protein ASPFODRAFT_409984 [Aspergillus luchuensis CBS 106.47]|uniref:Uncharacterized protein n=1 Tax=Aspergillus luchuensis (strain CBS 106.47) TaxID=1137211 RepID=A0A1M3T228_ASPLC|nr:hypothetical protein ASPFODRAFT_409984 [Aspergillus luchuensis CBS 106.47]